MSLHKLVASLAEWERELGMGQGAGNLPKAKPIKLQQTANDAYLNTSTWCENEPNGLQKESSVTKYDAHSSVQYGSPGLALLGLIENSI